MLEGIVGSIQWSYYTAAAIHGYRVTCSPDGLRWALRATVVQSDAFKLTQRPLVFVAPHAGGAWRFPVHALQLGAAVGELTATLGPMESTTGQGSL